MKKIAVFIFSFVVLACYGKAKMEISNETYLKLNPQMIPCAEKLKDFILSCSNFRLSFSEKNVHAKIEKGNGVYVIRLFKQLEAVQKWMKEAIKKTFVSVKGSYRNCTFSNNWLKK